MNELSAEDGDYWAKWSARVSESRIYIQQESQQLEMTPIVVCLGQTGRESRLQDHERGMKAQDEGGEQEEMQVSLPTCCYGGHLPSVQTAVISTRGNS